MSKRYNQRPSSVLNIDNDYLAYMFDEVALYLESEAMDDQGNINWNKIRWKKDKTEKQQSNKDFVEFVKKHK